MKFDNVYKEALVNMATPQNPSQTTTQPQGVQPKPKLDQTHINTLMQKWTLAKQNNQPLNLTPDELEAFGQLLGGDNPEPPQVSQTQKPQQTSTPPVNSPNTPAI